MGEVTKIAWCDSTFNPWIGCTKVSPGCDHCYAAEQDSRKRWDGGKTHWGAGVLRYRTSEANWRQPLAWNRKAAESGKPWRVFCASLADVFDNEIDPFWRRDLWDLIEQTPHLSWMLVTKRVGNVLGMMPSEWVSSGFPDHVRILITVCNQEEAERDVHKVLALPCKNGISYEPALGPVDWLAKAWWLGKIMPPFTHGRRFAGIEWIIVGGESGSKARQFNLDWARSTVEQCKVAGVPVFVKQLGSNPLVERDTCSLERAIREGGYTLRDRAGADPSEWPEDLRVREFPR